MNTHQLSRRVGFGCLLLIVFLSSCFLSSCGGANGEDARTDGQKLSSDDKAAADFIRSQLAEHWVKGADGWTTQFQLRNVFGKLVDGNPNVLYKQYRDLSFTLSPATLTEAMKLNGSDYRAEVGFKNSAMRLFRVEADVEGPTGWSNWKDDFLDRLAVERRNGKWIITDSNLFEGIAPTGTVP
jgi:hypothetical protein